MYKLKYALFLLLLFSIVIQASAQKKKEVESQVESPIRVMPVIPNDGVQPIHADTAITDTTRLDLSISPQDTTNTDSLAVNNSDLETTIKYSARDSIEMDAAQKIMTLYGDAKIDYGQISLAAEVIEINYITNQVKAKGIVDSTGEYVGKPVFTDDQTYVTDSMTYNFDTKKAFISGVVTQQGEAFIHGDNIKKNEENDVFIDNAHYTTCNLADPHFHIRANKLKVIPNDKIVTGPFNLYINDVPTPLGFAFGMFPAPRKKASGIIIPTYGEERLRGFFLREGGYYFAISDRIDLQLLGEIYSKGSKGFTVQSNYKKRYAHTGVLNFNFISQRLSENIEDSAKQNDFQFRWTHSPSNRTGGRFTASINAATSSYNQNNAMDVTSNLRSIINSTISYSTPLGRYFNVTVAARHNQNVRTRQVDIFFPEVSLNLNRIYPFKNLGGAGNAWYKKLFFAQNFNYSRRVTNQISPDSIAPFNFETFPELWKNAQEASSEPQPINFSIPISTSFRVLKYFTLSPAINHTEYIYFNRFDYEFDQELNKAVADTVRGVSRAFTTSGGAELTTMIYGFYVPKKGKIKGIRHVMTPTVGITFQPDYANKLFGYYDKVVNNEGVTQFLRRYNNAPAIGRNGIVNFSLRNVLEMKIKDDSDTTEQERKVPILEEFSIRSSYNLFADSLNLSDISLSARTRIFNNMIDISIQSVIDPYVYRLNSERMVGGERTVQQTQLNQFAWNNGQGLGQIRSANLSVGTNLNPSSTNRGNREVDPTERVSEFGTDEELAVINANPNLYVDWSVPWNLRINYNLTYSKNGFANSNIVQTATFSGDVSITDKWKIGFNSGYDFKNNELTNTRLNIMRDLHCWQMAFDWVPFGRFTSYSLNLNVKASILQDLKLSRRRSFRDNSSFTR